MKKVLITGASGLLGSNLARDLGARLPVTGIYHQHPVELPGVRMVAADLIQPAIAHQLLTDEQPELVIHCAAATVIDECERNPQLAQRLNRDMAETVAAATEAVGASLIHISTDAVYDGVQGSYRETDKASPINAYGRSKLDGEAAVQLAHRSALIVRTNLFGWNLPHKSNLIEWFLGRLMDGQECPGFTDVYFSPILVNQLGDLLLELTEAEASGVLHVAGATCLSKYEFGRMLAGAFGFDPELVRAAELSGAQLGAPRGRRLCLDCSRAEQLLGQAMPALEAGMRRLWELRDRSALALSERSGMVDAGA